MVENYEKFNSINELYTRLLPAIKTKIMEFRREKIYSLECYDIWNYCLNMLWKNKNDLRLYEMVNDILNIDYLKLNLYLKTERIDGISE